MQVHVLIAWTLCIILTFSVHGKILKTFDDGSRYCEMYKRSLYPIDRVNKLINWQINKPFLTWINEVLITDQEHGFIINVTGRVDIPKNMPIVCWKDAIWADFKASTKMWYMYLDPEDRYFLECDMTKTVSPTDLIYMVQQNIINESDEYVVFNFDIYDHANRQCAFLSKSKQRAPVNCSNKFPTRCYGRLQQQTNTVISVSKLCPEDLKSSSELTPNDDKLPSACNKPISDTSTNAKVGSSVSIQGTREMAIMKDDISTKEPEEAASLSDIARTQSGSSSATDGMMIYIIVGAVFGVFVISIVVLVYLKRYRRGKSDKNDVYLTAATNQNTTDDTHRYAVPTVYDNTREDETATQTYTHDYISVI